MKVLLFLPKGFETMEMSVFVDVFGWAKHDHNADVSLETAGFTQIVDSTFHMPVVVDKLIEDISVDVYDALAIPGGFADFGFFEEGFDEKFLELIRKFHEQGKMIATICVASLVLGESGILKNKRATTYHLSGGKRQKQLAAYENVHVVNERIVIDENIITSYCPETAVDVAFTLLSHLVGVEKMQEVKVAMGYDAI